MLKWNQKQLCNWSGIVIAEVWRHSSAVFQGTSVKVLVMGDGRGGLFVGQPGALVHFETNPCQYTAKPVSLCVWHLSENVFKSKSTPGRDGGSEKKRNNKGHVMAQRRNTSGAEITSALQPRRTLCQSIPWRISPLQQICASELLLSTDKICTWEGKKCKGKGTTETNSFRLQTSSYSPHTALS